MQRQSGLQKELAKPRIDKRYPVENAEHMAQATKPSEGIRDMHLMNNVVGGHPVSLLSASVDLLSRFGHQIVRNGL